MLGGLIDLSSFKIPVTRFTREEPEKSLKVVGAGELASELRFLYFGAAMGKYIADTLPEFTGLGRTGTASLHCALVRLGFG